MEQPDAAERHGNAVLIAGVNDLLVADRAAGLDNGGHAGAAGTLDVVTVYSLHRTCFRQIL